MRKYIIPIFVPHRGCAHSCVFCNQNSITGSVSDTTANDVDTIVLQHLSTIGKDANGVEIAFFGGSFTAIPKQAQQQLLFAAHKYVESGAVESIRISTRPDCIDKETLDTLHGFGVRTIELGVQSMGDGVLALSARGHTAGDVLRAVALIREHGGFALGLQMMVGLPGDDGAASIDTARKIVALSPKFARIYPTLVIKNTKLEHMFNSGEYQPISLEQAVELCKTIAVMFEAASIKIIRIGLQATDTICDDGDVVAGPFHPAFGELVLARKCRDELDELASRLCGTMGARAVVTCTKKDISKVVGQGRCNILYIKKKYGFRDINIETSEKSGLELRLVR